MWKMQAKQQADCIPQAQQLANYLDQQSEIAQQLLKINSYQNLALQAHRNFRVPQFVQQRTKSQPKFSQMQSLLAQSYVQSPAVSMAQKQRFQRSLSKIQVPCRNLSKFQFKQQYSGPNVANYGILQQQELNTEAAILNQVSEFDKPISQQNASTISLKKYLRDKQLKQDENQNILLQKQEEDISKEQKYEIAQHKRFWSQIQLLSEKNYKEYATKESISAAACNVRPSNIVAPQCNYCTHQRAKSTNFRQRKSRLALPVKYEDLSQERASFRSRSCVNQECRQEYDRGWKGYNIKEIQEKQKDNFIQPLCEIGLGQDDQSVKLRRSSARQKNYGCSRSKSASASVGEPLVLQQFKTQVNNQIVRLARAHSVSSRRDGMKQAQGEELQENGIQKTEPNDVAGQSQGLPTQTARNDLDERQSQRLKSLQNQILIPGTSPLPAVFMETYGQLAEPEQPKPQVALEEAQTLDWQNRIIHKLSKESLIAKAAALNLPTQQLQQLQTYEDIEEARLQAIRDYVPPVRLSERQIYINKQKELLANAQFPVETYPQLAIFTKFSTLQVQSEREQLSQNIQYMQSVENAEGKPQSLSTSESQSENGDTDVQYQQNRLRELRAQAARSWNAEIERIMSKRREFRRRQFVRSDVQAESCANQAEIAEQIDELLGNE